jgi:hypothetical protein
VRAQAQQRSSDADRDDGSATGGSVLGRVFAATDAFSPGVKGSAAPAGGSSRGSGAPFVKPIAFLALAIAALVLMVVPTFASAAVPKHPFLEAFGSAAIPALAKPEGVAVDQSTGDVLVVDKGGNETQVVAFSGFVEGDKYKLEGLPTGVSGECTGSSTAALEYSTTLNTNQSAIEAELNALCGGANVKVSTSGSFVTVEFKGVFEKTPESLLACARETGTGACSLERRAGGHKSGVYRYKENGEPDVFTATGKNVLAEGGSVGFQSEVEVAVDDSGNASTNGNIYLALGGANKALKIYNKEGTELTALNQTKTEGAFAGRVCGVAVNSSGTVYLSEFGSPSGHVRTYVPSGGVTEPIKGSDETGDFTAEIPCGIAAGAGPTAGYLFLDQANTRTVKYTTAGVEQYVLTGAGTTVEAVSVDPGSGHVYVAALTGGGNAVLEYNAAGAAAKEVSQITLEATLGSLPQGVAVNQATGNVYTSRSVSPAVEVWASPAGPTVAGVSPVEGPTAGGREVTITGSEFQFGVEKVSFGATEVICAETVATCKVESSTTIRATVPAHTEGTVDVTVTTAGGASGISSADHYTFVPPPSLTTVVPGEGPTAGGQVVTLTGEHFTGATEVRFGIVGVVCDETVAHCKVESPTEIKVTTPALLPAGSDPVTVTTPFGTSATQPYTAVEAPALTTVNPNEGPTGGGQVVTITGERFVNAGKVEFGSTVVTCDGTVAHCKVESATTIKVTTPALPAGSNPVKVTALGGTSATQPYTAIEAPTVTNVTPNEGTETGGAVVTITGARLTGTKKVSFGGTEVTCAGTVATCKVESATEVKATTPAHVPGVVDVQVTAIGGLSPVNAPADHFTFKSATGTPSVSSVGPNEGPEAGGQVVTLTGTEFTGAEKVSFGSTVVTCDGTVAHCKVESSTTIKVTTPAHAEGTVDVTVTGSGGTSPTASADHYAYLAPPTIGSVSPKEGPAAGGAVITVAGTHLGHATEVKFGATVVACDGTVAHCKVESDTEIKTTAPAHAEGKLAVVVCTPGGCSSSSVGPANEFAFVAAPTVTGVSPDSGTEAGGTVVTITGTGLANAEKVEFGSTLVACDGTIAHCKVEPSGTEIKATTPAHAIGAVHVRVSTVGGISPVNAPLDEFTYTAAPPTVTAIGPTEGPTAGGQVVTITGTELTGAKKVSFGGSEVACAGTVATCKVESPTEIKATTPSRAAGTFDVTVTTGNGASPISPADRYTYIAPPAVMEVSPAQGSIAGGSTVTITGLRLAGATAVRFGETEAAIIEDTQTTITVTAPAHTVGAVHVQVTTLGGVSGKFVADEYTFEGAQSLTVSTAGSGSGAVGCNGGACASSYPYGSAVTLSAAPASGSTFAGWSGAGCSGTGNCTVTIQGPVAVTATFDKKAEEQKAETKTEGTKEEPKGGGTPQVSGNVPVTGNIAALKLTCTGPGACKGRIVLKVKIKHGKKTETITIGTGSYEIAAGRTATVKIKIVGGQVKSLLNNGKTVTATYSGQGLKSGTVKLKTSTKNKKGRRR